MLADLEVRHTMPGHTAVSHDTGPSAQSTQAQTAVAGLPADGAPAWRCVSDGREAAYTLTAKDSQGHAQKGRTHVYAFLNTKETSSSVPHKYLQM